MEFKESELRAYLAGDMPPDAAGRLEEALEHNAELEARLLALEPLAEPLRSVFETLPERKRLPTASDLAPPTVSKRANLVQYGLVAGIAGLLGVALATQFASRPDLSWQEQVAVYQALYVEETVASLAPSPADLKAQFARASDVLGLSLSPSDFNDLQGVDLKRAQVLGFQGTPLIQIAFASEDGAPVAFCILKRTDTSGPVKTELSGLPTIHWADGQYGYMLIGDMSPQTMSDLAMRLGAEL